MSKSNLTGLVLAGGRSRRMGSPKSLVEFGEKCLIEYPLNLLDKVCSELFIVTKNPEHYRRFNRNTLTDLSADAGPMGGIYTGLSSASNHWTVVLACDLPLVRKQLLLGLIRQIEKEENLQAVIPLAPSKAGGELLKQPLCALYSKNCLDFFRRRIEASQVSLVESMSAPETKYISWLELDPEDKSSLSFTNINTREELQSARDRIRAPTDSIFPSFNSGTACVER